MNWGLVYFLFTWNERPSFTNNILQLCLRDSVFESKASQTSVRSLLISKCITNQLELAEGGASKRQAEWNARGI